MSTDSAISRLRRDLLMGSVVKFFLVLAGAVALVLPAVAPSIHPALGLLLVFVLWITLSYSSAKNSQLSADSPALIAAGDYDEAERRIEASIGRFNLVPAVKLQAMHHLALLRHAQKRFRESAALCRELLARRKSGAAGISKPTRLLLADAMLELDDVQGAYEALRGLYAERLSLPEVLRLMVSQLDYEARVGAYDRMAGDIMTKVQLAELMPASAAARTQALLALAAKRTGRDDFCQWLAERAALLADPQTLVQQRPILGELWSEPTPRVIATA